MPLIDSFFMVEEPSIEYGSNRRSTRSSARFESTQPTQLLADSPAPTLQPRQPHGLPHDTSMTSSMSSVHVIDLGSSDSSRAGSEPISGAQDTRIRETRALSPPLDLGLDFGESLALNSDDRPAVADSAGEAENDSDKENTSPHSCHDCTHHHDGSKTVKTNSGLILVPAKFNARAAVRFMFNLRWYRRATASELKYKTGDFYAYGECVVDEITGAQYWLCHCCKHKGKDRIYAISGTGSIRKHLREKHGVRFANDRDSSPVDTSAPAAGGIVNQIFSIAGVFKERFLLFFLMCNLSFYQVENVYFRDLLGCMNLQLFNFLPKASVTIRRWVMDEFKDRKARLKEEFAWASVLRKVSTSFDLWTSPNCHALMAVCGHYIDKDGFRRHTLIALRPIHGAHTAENISEVLTDIYREYGLDKQSRFGWIVSDNAVVNDKIVDLVLKDLFPQWTRQQRIERRLRCFGHVVNIGAQKFLHGIGSEEVMDEMNEARQSGNSERIADLWRRIGALGILHNLIRYIRMTPQRRGEFARCIVGGVCAMFDHLMLIPPNQTRCNSAYVALTRALNLRLRINQFQSSHRPEARSRVRFEPLNATHWDTLEAIHDALEPFYDVTVDSEGFKDDLSGYVQNIDYLHKHISQSEALWTQNHALSGSVEDEALAAAAHQSWLVLEKYYNLCDKSPAYYAAMAINPTLKWHWCMQEWGSDSEKEDWLPSIQNRVNDFWLTEYKGTSTVAPSLARSTSSSLSESSSTGAKRKRTGGIERTAEELREYKRVKGYTARYTDAFEQYLQQPLEAEGVDALAYWNVRWASGQQRDLAQMALDLLAIPSMSAECERVFSQTALLITDRRNRLKDDIVEACECLRYWMTDKGKVAAFDGDNEGSEGINMVDEEFVDDIPGFGEEPEEEME